MNGFLEISNAIDLNELNDQYCVRAQSISQHVDAGQLNVPL